MRNARRLVQFGFAIVVLCGGVLVAGMTQRPADVTYTDLFNPMGLPNPLGVPAVGQLLDPGTTFCPGHALTGDPMQPCEAGSATISRNFRMRTRVDSASPSLAGWMTIEASANLAPDFTGPAFGKFSLELDEGGRWDGTWNGPRRLAGDSLWIADLKVVGHGLGGKVDGMQMKCVEVITEVTPMPVFYKGVATCRLLQYDEE